MSENFVANSSFKTATIAQRYWLDVSIDFRNRDKVRLDLLVRLCVVYGRISINDPEIDRFYFRVVTILENTEEESFNELSFDLLNDLVWSLSYKQFGDQNLWKKLDKIVCRREEIDSIENLHKLCKIASFFTRLKQDDFKVFQKLTKLINQNIDSLSNADINHQIMSMYFLVQIPQVDLQIKNNLLDILFDTQRNQNEILSLDCCKRLAQIIDSRELSCQQMNYFINHYLQYIINESDIDIDLTIFAYCYSNLKQSETLLQQFENAIVKKLQQTNFNELSYDKLIESFELLTSKKVQNQIIWQQLQRFSENCIDNSSGFDFYPIKFAFLYSERGNYPKSIIKKIHDRLIDQDSLPEIHGRNLSRAINACQFLNELQSETLMNRLESKLFYNSSKMNIDEMAQSIYSLSILNIATPETMRLIEKRILQGNLEQMLPKNLGCASYAFSQLGGTNFIKSSAFFVSKIVNQYLSGSELDIAATNLIQFGWLLSLNGSNFQNQADQLLNPLVGNLKITNSQFTTNEWIWDLKRKNDYDYFNQISPELEYLMHLIILQAQKGKQKLPEPSIQINQLYNNEFIDQVHSITKQLDSMSEKNSRIFNIPIPLTLNNTVILPYTRQNYQFQTKNYIKEAGSQSVLGLYKQTENTLTALGIDYLAISKGEWDLLQTDNDKIDFILQETADYQTEY